MAGGNDIRRRWCRPGPGHALRFALVAGAVLVAPLPAGAVIVGGGGSARTDCLAVLDAPANTPASRPRHVRCTDGDACDADGTVNGICQFAVKVCANSTFDSRCTLAGVESITVDHADDNDPTDTRFDPEFQAVENAIEAGISLPTSDPDQCTTSIDLHVAIDGPLHGVCRKGKKLLRVTTESEFMAGKVYSDRDRLRLTCDPSPSMNGCSPLAFFDGTLDRIQRQVFSKSCALTPCHVSNWSFLAGYLVLETGSSHGALENQTPAQSGAMMAGWKRVDVPVPGSGDPSTSLLFHKLNRTSGLSVAYGAPMPFGKKRLDQYLIDTIELWILAGAPEMGWVPGTDQ